ncbi:MAG TPA: glycosyl hydrolase family 18 protein, partial [Thermoanaerobaculia bacterium]|nr:glycosyl hydrolase family 18 protein [Thermoanaerobaculia bacterium]
DLRTRLAVAVLLTLISATARAARVSVWIPPWDANALTSVQRNVDAITESNPVWYSWNTDGTIAKNWNAENATWRAAMTGTRLIPTVQNVVNKAFSASTAATVLGTAASREAHAASIAQLVILNAFDGIDIDYERVPTTSRADFTAFVDTLAQKLHATGKQLSITVYPKTSDSQNWNGPGSQDWVTIGRLADSVKIMAYDFHWSTSDAGAITPIDWLHQVATYAESVIPAAKIMMGLPWYGYDWVGTNGATMSYAAAMQLSATNGIAIQRDANDEPTFKYADHTVYFQDATSFGRKIEMLKLQHGKIGGWANWAAGQEDPAIWNMLRLQSTPLQTGATPAPTMKNKRRI